MKKIKKYAKEMVKSGIILGVGSQAVSRVGGETGGLANLSSAMPKVGAIAGAGIVLSSLDKLKPKKRRRR